MAAKKTSFIKGINPNLLLIGGVGALAYFGVLNPLFKWVGIKKDTEEKKTDKAIEETEKANGWSPNYYNDNRNKGWGRFNDAHALSLATRIKKAWGWFNDNENEIFAVIRECASQFQLSQLVGAYAKLTGDDLLTRLKNPYNKWDDGLLPEEFAIVAKIVNGLPNFTKA